MDKLGDDHVCLRCGIASGIGEPSQYSDRTMNSPLLVGDTKSTMGSDKFRTTFDELVELVLAARDPMTQRLSDALNTSSCLTAQPVLTSVAFWFALPC